MRLRYELRAKKEGNGRGRDGSNWGNKAGVERGCGTGIAQSKDDASAIVAGEVKVMAEERTKRGSRGRDFCVKKRQGAPDLGQTR